ncbi:malonyl-ACP O-methyltransferase BioC [Vibrio sp. RC27]
MMDLNHTYIDSAVCKKSIAAAFGRAASSYDNHAKFQRNVGYQLLDLMPQSLCGKRVLDLGCGTGYFSQRLLERGAEVVCGDISVEMLEQARLRCGTNNVTYSLCDAEAMNFADDSFDYVFSSLALQWCDDLSAPLAEIKRIIKPEGVGYFTTLLDGSLIELSQAWSKVDSYQHVNRFISRNRVKLALAQSEVSSHHLSLQTITQRYSSALALMKDLKGIGATHIQARPKGLFTRETLDKVELEYRAISGNEDFLPATYQVCFGMLQP